MDIVHRLRPETQASGGGAQPLSFAPTPRHQMLAGQQSQGLFPVQQCRGGQLWVNSSSWSANSSRNWKEIPEIKEPFDRDQVLKRANRYIDDQFVDVALTLSGIQACRD